MISVSNLSKSFGGVLAVDNLSFKVEPGDIIGFLGPNGAGKSTTMKMLTGFLNPTSGSISINGNDIKTAPVLAKRAIGYLPEGAPAYGDMSVYQFLSFITQIRQIEKSQQEARIEAVSKLVELTQVLDKPIEQLSKGFKRRVGLAQAIIHNPDILILDEPTDGLDPNQKHQVRSLIKNLSKDKIVIVSTHILEEVSAVCNRVMVIANGQMKFDGTPKALQQQSKYFQAVTLVFDGAMPLQALSSIKSVGDMEVDELHNQVTLIPSTENQLLQEVSELIASNALTVQQMFVESGRLDQVFRDMTRGEAV